MMHRAPNRVSMSIFGWAILATFLIGLGTVVYCMFQAAYAVLAVVIHLFMTGIEAAGMLMYFLTK